MMAMDVEQGTRIIDTLASTNYQVQHDRQTVQKKGVLDLLILLMQFLLRIKS